MLNQELLPFSKSLFEKLTNSGGLYCVSMYVPMYKKGKEQNDHLAQDNLKHCIKEVTNKLKKHQLSENEIKKYLNPIEKLLTNTEMWRNPSNGLALFLNKNGLTHYKLPLNFKTQTYVANHFYLLPLLQIFHNNGDYYVLELSQDYVQLYEATKYGFNNLFVEDFAPTNLENAVGFDYKQKMLQFRSGQNAFTSGSFHGHGEGKDDDKKEIETFLRAINKGINKLIINKKAPLIIAGTNALFNMYQQTNTYPNLYKTNISGDSEFKNKNLLHANSWKLIKSYFEIEQNEKINQFSELYHTPKISYDTSDIILSSFDGKIDTLFIERGKDFFGAVNTESRNVHIDSEREIQNGSLVNSSAINTFLKGGKVYVLPKEKMPIKGKILNAIYRF
jgi:hypothetical protein